MTEQTIVADVTDLEAGTAGEHLVMADLLLSGHRAIMADQHDFDQLTFRAAVAR